MRKGTVAVGLVALALVFSATPFVLSQMQTPSDEPESQASVDVDSDRLRLEIAMLRAINDMDLSAEQLETLHSIVADLRSRRDRIIEAQRSLRDFLVQFEGSRDEYHDAVRSYEDELSQARTEFRQALQDAIDQAKRTFTIQQGQILREHLNRSLGRARSRVEIRAQVDRERPDMRIWQQQGECLTDRLGESMNRLRERVGDMLDRFGLDGQMLENWKREWQEHIVCPPMPEERPWRPDVRIYERPRLDIEMNLERFRDLMMGHLDTLEKVLNERLSALRSTQASMPGESTSDRRALLQTS